MEIVLKIIRYLQLDKKIDTNLSMNKWFITKSAVYGKKAYILLEKYLFFNIMSY